VERSCDWQQDEDRKRLDNEYREREAADEACADRDFVASEAERR
jgi:hypothetical protein